MPLRLACDLRLTSGALVASPSYSLYYPTTTIMSTTTELRWASCWRGAAWAAGSPSRSSRLPSLGGKECGRSSLSDIAVSPVVQGSNFLCYFCTYLSLHASDCASHAILT